MEKTMEYRAIGLKELDFFKNYYNACYRNFSGWKRYENEKQPA